MVEHSYPDTAGLRAFANARKDAELQLGTLDKALRRRVERRMREEPVSVAQEAWKPIATAPKDGSLVLLFNSLGNQHIGRWGMRYLGDPGPEAWCNHGKYIAQPTHWQPLPQGPALSSTDPRCTCAAIVNPNIPHARSCPLSTNETGEA